MQKQRSLVMWRCALALTIVPAVSLVVVVGQMAVSQQASAPPPIQSQSVRYGGGGLLPSEQRNVRWQSGLLPSEQRDVQWGSLPSQGLTAGAPNTLRYSSYNSYYSRTADSMTSGASRFKRTYNSPTSAPSIRYSHVASPSGTYRPAVQTGSYSFNQSYNSYRKVTSSSSSISTYKAPSIRYGH